MPPIKKKTKNKYKQTKEERKSYQKYIDKQSVKLRLSVDERTYLEIKMREDGWSNLSGYIRHILFGESVKKRLWNKLKKAEIEDVFTYISNTETLLSDRANDYFSRMETIITKAEEKGLDRDLYNNLRQDIYRFYARVLKGRQILLDDLEYLIALYENNSSN